LFNKDGSAYTGKVDKFTQKTVDALGQISKSAEGSAMIQELQSSKNTFTIEKGSDNSFTPDNQRASYSNIPEIQSAIPSLITSSGSGGKIIFNPSTTTSGFNTAGNTNRPSFIGLAHEMVHGRDSNNGVLYPYTDFNSFKGEFNGLYKSEWRSTFYENTIRGQLGVPLRSSYGVSDDGQGNFAPIGPSLLDSSKKPINYTIK
ncbi:M91 family zinc metallopeptidase, partial [Flavobacterium columnare]